MMEFHHRHRSWEAFDRITLELVERYKTSGMSGDEWRFSVSAKFFFKGIEVHSTTFLNMRNALMGLPWEWITAQEPIPEQVIELEKTLCYQPGCREKHTTLCILNKMTSDNGHYLDPKEYASYTNFRRFCDKHSKRGDCDREDADDNYTKTKL